MEARRRDRLAPSLEELELTGADPLALADADWLELTGSGLA